MKYNKKGQAALEFLTTYGWAFLVILVMIGGLSYFGVFDFSKYLPESCSLDGKLECGDSFAAQASTDMIAFQIKNNNQKKVDFVSITVIEKGLGEGTTVPCTLSDHATSASAIADGLASGQQLEYIFDVGAADTCGIDDNEGSKKTFNIEITYTLAGSSIQQISRGTLTTTVQ